MVLEADICIAGGGAAGITLARELRGSGAEVLLLEAGPESRDEDHQTLYEGETSGEAEASQLKNSRLRAFGGTTGHWSGWCQALEPIDFESRDWIPRSGWPLDRETLDPFYRRAVDDVEIGASEWDASTIMERAGRALLPFDETNATSVLYQYSPPTRFGEAYGDDLEAADNVEVYLHANVVHIALNANGDAVERLECETLEGNSFTAEADEFVVAMGGLETPRMLLASNDRKSDGIGNDHGHHEQWLEWLRGGAHHMGTTRMSARPEKGVVDADCKVHGVDNLYVGGSSIYPSVGAANPTLTLVALAIRLADHLEAQV